jgi:hypothetical protein
VYTKNIFKLYGLSEAKTAKGLEILFLKSFENPEISKKCQEPPTICRKWNISEHVKNLQLSRTTNQRLVECSNASLHQVVLEHAQKLSSMCSTRASGACHQSEIGWKISDILTDGWHSQFNQEMITIKANKEQGKIMSLTQPDR